VARVLVEIPRVGLVMETARVQRWLKAVGDTVSPGEPLVEVETEKALVEIEASVAGTLVEIVAQAEQEIAVGAPLAWVEDGQPERAAAEPPAPAAVAAAAPARAKFFAPATEKPRASPAARKLAAERGIDLSTVQGSGPHGRIQIEDVERAASAPAEARRDAPASAGEQARRPLSPMRRAVARAMTLSNATVPQFIAARSVDWTSVLALRTALAQGRPQQAIDISVNDFLLQAVARTLLEFPSLNAVFAGDANSPDAHIVPASGTHIGLVVALEDGMLVPVLHGVERLGLHALAQARAGLVERAQQGRLRQDDAAGATFTISNLGARGPDRFTAILNPPESAILAVGRMREVPAVRDGAVTVRPVSELTLTVDHRLADGRLASDFLARLVEMLEAPDWARD